MDCKKATGVWSFQGKEYEINLDISNDKLTVEVQDTETADQWRASFLSKNIEDLTRKTGNFKHITVFVNMLESAVLKSSDSVALELLTYTDLENLRQRRKPTLSTKPSPSSSLPSKRYLILTHSTEFDRIHYPLALPYVGKPDPVELQEMVRHLQQELDKYKSKANQRASSSTFIRLQKKYDALLAEKEELERVLEEVQLEMAEEGGLHGREDLMSLRDLVRKLEESSLKEKNKFQKLLCKKNDDIKALSIEIEDLRTSERLLSSRVKSLTNELAMMRRHSPIVVRSSSQQNRTNTRNRSGGTGSNQRSNIRYTPPAAVSTEDRFSRRRSSSLENNAVGRTRGSGTMRSRTPSPRGFQRFNPTAYVENKRRTQDEIDSRTRRARSRSSSVGSINRATPPRHAPLPVSRKINIGSTGFRSTSSVGSGRSSRHSSVESLVDTSDDRMITTKHKREHRNTNGKRQYQSSSSTPKPSRVIRKKHKHNNSSQMDHSIEIKEIDARLNALQQYMKKSLEKKK